MSGPFHFCFERILKLYTIGACRMCVWKSCVCVVFLKRYERGDNNNIRLSVVWWCRCCLIKKTLATLSNSERKSCLLDVRFLFYDLPSHNAWEDLRFLIEMLSHMV